MTAVNRALMLCVPLFAFALAGAMYTPPASQNHLPGEGQGEVTLSSLPPLPEWAYNGLPDFTAYQDSTEKKVSFFSYLYPRIVLANSRILLEREYLASLADKAELTSDELDWLARQGDRLRIEARPGSQQQFALLNKRLDVIPPSLILAQAANESAWGTSRFATEGNNLFGQWCFSKGCGLVPQSRLEGANHEVAKFRSPYFSVRSYIQNLNRHPTYQAVRDIRLADRKAHKPLSGWELAEGLLGYSERGQDYIREIRAMIRYNNLDFYDQEFRTLLGDRTPAQFERLASAKPDTALLPGGSSGRTSPFEG
ncbi:glucosaminidase domain-containing protein [Marinobacter daepoensis]|uniref:Glucosaminidase domain-containing protein n=1 Tax=Marinobacter daepoensis TaxID=262077 RepID=A0ABS3BHS6_9GAMM|nr:glucosaminidase domain-containing protein [Marinobacter daepoensis]MBN7771224.1 glucosaminidase domain-containing protein [Marinobacter daepoensis]MBY6033566.1 glucosaminidase domain-containing protein [Marinobacter daepoensis]MBY6079086.1 glucosaminidase domain-containing protein [Marinobacter daepoensis]